MDDPGNSDKRQQIYTMGDSKVDKDSSDLRQK